MVFVPGPGDSVINTVECGGVVVNDISNHTAHVVINTRDQFSFLQHSWLFNAPHQPSATSSHYELLELLASEEHSEGGSDVAEDEDDVNDEIFTAYLATCNLNGVGLINPLAGGRISGDVGVFKIVSVILEQE